MTFETEAELFRKERPDLAGPIGELHHQPQTETRTTSMPKTLLKPRSRKSQDGGAARPIRRHSLHHVVVDRLRNMIVEGDLAPGARVDEGGLCEEFGISRTPLREALKVLASEGLVELRPNRGTRVLALTATEVKDLFETVAGIERLAAEVAAERMSESDLEWLAKRHDRLEALYEEGRRREYFRLNHEIHNAIVQLSGNEVLFNTHSNLMARVRRARFMAILSEERWSEAIAEHREIMAAFVARDAKLAGDLMFVHDMKTCEVAGKAMADKELDAAE